MKKKTQAFTLIEMLVVVVVLGVLAGLLFPAFNTIRESGRTTKCASNLHQLQIAALECVNDLTRPILEQYRFPRNASYWEPEPLDPGNAALMTLKPGWIGWSTLPAAPTIGAYNWRGAPGLASITNGELYKYVGRSEVYLCPTFDKVCQDGRTNNAVRSYAMSSYLDAGLITSIAIQPSKWILFGDRLLIDTNTVASFTPTVAPDSKAIRDLWKGHGDSRTNSPRASGNAVFVDGHVERLK